MTKVLSLCVLLLCTSAFAKTLSATFAYGAPSGSQSCAGMTEWNGVANGYPQDMGGICFNYPYSGMDIPFQLGFPNNGFLLDNTPISWQAPVFTSGNSTTAGSTYYQVGTATYTGLGAGVMLHVTSNFVIVLQKRCPRYGTCHYVPVGQMTGGAGTVTYQ